MDALEFIKAIKQMLSAGANNSTVQKYISAYKKNDCEGMVEAAEQWAAAHPIKTRMSVFLEQWPDARIKKADGLPMVSPCELDGKLAGKCDGIHCPECRKKFWLAEVEDT